MVIADIIARYKKTQNCRVYLQTGSDDHGEKNFKKALSLNLDPQELVDNNVRLFQELWKKLNISEHFFYRTSSPLHKKKIQEIFTKLLKQDDIYLSKYKGNYCISCEDYIINKNEKNFCPSCHSSLQIIEQPAYFLRIKKYYSWLIEYYNDNLDFIIPNNIKKEIINNFLSDDIRDLCITRQDMPWGVIVPNEPHMTIYVWFEALLNYLISPKGEQNFSRKNNQTIVHIIGKDISRFHCFYWPIMLKILNIRLPNKIIIHGLIMNRGYKMSKSKGNVINPLTLLDNYTLDSLRAYFVAKIHFLQDGLIEEKLIQSFHQEFSVNNLSNLVSRINNMICLYYQKIIPRYSETDHLILKKYYSDCILLTNNFKKEMDDYKLTNAFEQINKLIGISNKLINDILPWELAKKNNHKTLETTLNYLINGIKITAFLLSSIMPETAHKMFNMININQKDEITWDNCLDFSYLNDIKINPLEEHMYKKKLNLT